MRGEMRQYVISKILLISLLIVSVSGTIVCADENPQPWWDSAGWNQRSWANNEATLHISLFLHARDAKRHCPPEDGVAWLDRSSGVLFSPDTRIFHHAIGGHGGYFVCDRQARRAGAMTAPRKP
jgi:hypothetical protein